MVTILDLGEELVEVAEVLLRARGAWCRRNWSVNETREHQRRNIVQMNDVAILARRRAMAHEA